MNKWVAGRKSDSVVANLWPVVCSDVRFSCFGGDKSKELFCSFRSDCPSPPPLTPVQGKEEVQSALSLPLSLVITQAGTRSARLDTGRERHPHTGHYVNWPMCARVCGHSFPSFPHNDHYYDDHCDDLPLPHHTVSVSLFYSLPLSLFTICPSAIRVTHNCHLLLKKGKNHSQWHQLRQYYRLFPSSSLPLSISPSPSPCPLDSAWHFFICSLHCFTLPATWTKEKCQLEERTQTVYSWSLTSTSDRQK